MTSTESQSHNSVVTVISLEYYEKEALLTMYVVMWRSVYPLILYLILRFKIENKLLSDTDTSYRTLLMVCHPFLKTGVIMNNFLYVTIKLKVKDRNRFKI